MIFKLLSEVNPVHILHVTPYFPPTWAYGGIPRVAYGLGRAQILKGARVSVWTTDAFDGDRRSEVAAQRRVDGMEVMTSRNLSNRLAYRQQLFLPRPPPQGWLREQGVDLVHLHGHRHLLNTWAVRACRQEGIPWVMTPNGTLPRIEKKQWVKRLWDPLFADEAPRGAARMIAVSPAEVGHFLRWGIPAERIARIPNGLTLAEFSPLPEEGRFRSRWGLEGPVVAYLGQISPRKGVQHLVRAFSGPQAPPATLVVAGNDMGAMEEAKSAAGDGVLFTGLLEGQERLELLVDADVLVYPTSDEIFGLVPFEGLLCGTPVVVGGDCGCGQLIGAAGAGLLVRHADLSGLRARIQTLLQDRPAAGAMVRRGREYIEQKLRFEVVAEQHLALYREVLDEGREHEA